MFGSIFNDLQKFINDLRKLLLFFTQALNAAPRPQRSRDHRFHQGMFRLEHGAARFQIIRVGIIRLPRAGSC